MAWRSNKKGLAIVGLFLFLMGVVVPAAFGLLTEKAMELGTADLLDKSTNWDASNIANSTYFISKQVIFRDNATGSWYSPDMVYDDTQDMELVLMETGAAQGSYTGSTDSVEIRYELNKTAMDNVDKVVVLVKIEDPAVLDLNSTLVRVYLRDVVWGEDYKFFEEKNATANATMRFEFEIDALKRLKIDSSSDNPMVSINLIPKDGQSINVDSVILGTKVELYDVKKVNATAASNIMLAVSGVLGWLGALAATPYWNPYANREHRNVRRVGHAIRRRIPRRRR